MFFDLLGDTGGIGHFAIGSSTVLRFILLVARTGQEQLILGPFDCI